MIQNVQIKLILFIESKNNCGIWNRLIWYLNKSKSNKKKSNSAEIQKK